MRNNGSLSRPPHGSRFPGTLRRRLLKGLGANAIGQVLNLSSRVLLAPLFLRAWGADAYGTWLLLSSFVAYLALMDMGGQLYIVNRLTQAYSEQDFALFRKVLHTGLAAFLIMSTAVFLLFIAALSSVPSDLFLPASSKTDDTIVVWVLAILAFQFLFSLPLGILLGTYRAVGLLPRGTMLHNLVFFLQLIFTVGALWLGGGMVWIASMETLPFLLVATFAAGEINKRFPQFGLLSLKEADYSTALTLIKPSLHFFSIQIAQLFSIQGMVLIVGAVLAPLQVVIFSTIRTMVAAMRQLLGFITLSAWPELTRLDVEQETDKLFVMFRTIIRSTLVVAAVIIVTLYFFGGTIYRLWLGGTVAYQQTIMDLFLVYAFELVFWTVCSHLLMATNKHHTLAKVVLGSSLLMIALAYLGGQYFGLRGIVAGMIASDLLLPFWLVPYLVNRYQKRFSMRFFLKELAPIIGSLIGAVLMPWLTPLILLLLSAWWASSIRSMAILK